MAGLLVIGLQKVYYTRLGALHVPVHRINEISFILCRCSDLREKIEIVQFYQIILL